MTALENCDAEQNTRPAAGAATTAPARSRRLCRLNFWFLNLLVKNTTALSEGGGQKRNVDTPGTIRAFSRKPFFVFPIPVFRLGRTADTCNMTHDTGPEGDIHSTRKREKKNGIGPGVSFFRHPMDGGGQPPPCLQPHPLFPLSLIPALLCFPSHFAPVRRPWRCVVVVVARLGRPWRYLAVVVACLGLHLALPALVLRPRCRGGLLSILCSLFFSVFELEGTAGTHDSSRGTGPGGAVLTTRKTRDRDELPQLGARFWPQRRRIR